MMTDSDHALLRSLGDIGRVWQEALATAVRTVNSSAAFEAAAARQVALGGALARLVDEARAEIEEGLRRIEQLVRYPSVSEETLESVRRLQEAFERASARDRAMIHMLAENGWYIDISRMARLDLVEFGKMFESDRIGPGHEALSTWYEEQMEGFARELQTSFPHRARFVEQALAAHRRAEYGLSVPAFLVQADGICQELVDVQAFRQENNRLALARVIEARAGDSVLCAALMALMPLVYGRAKRRESPSSDLLNRHAVVHGEDLNYDTRRKSCQAFSFLAHIVSVLAEFRQPVAAA